MAESDEIPAVEIGGRAWSASLGSGYSAGRVPTSRPMTIPDLVALVSALSDEQKGAVLDALNACPKYMRDVFEEKLNEYIDKVKDADRERAALALELERVKAGLGQALDVSEARRRKLYRIKTDALYRRRT